jgi:glycosyltransferase involved in cell wall biosynthesis
MSDIIVFRVITSNYCVKAHLDNTLRRIPSDFKLFVLGDDVKSLALDYPNVIFINIPLKRNFSFFNDILSIFLLFFYFIKHRPRIIHSLMTKAGFLTAIIGFFTLRPIRIHTFTGQVWATRQGMIRDLLKLVDKIICLFNNYCFTDSKSQSSYLFKNGISHKNKLIPYFLNGSLSGVDLLKFNPLKITNEKIHLTKKYSLAPDDFVLGYIARKSIDKGCIDMLKIFSKVLEIFPDKTIKLLFIGPDESNGQVSIFLNSNSKLNKNIIDLGFVTDHHIFISLCDLMCLPSHREGFGSIVIDSAALGVPTIGYDIPGLVDSILDGYSGLLVDLNDIEAFSDNIVKLIKDKSKLKELSINSRQFAIDNFDADIFNIELFNFYSNV